MGIVLIWLGYVYYRYEYDYKYGFRVPAETGLLFIFVGLTIVFYELLRLVKSKDDADS